MCVCVYVRTHTHKRCILIILINDEQRASGHDCEPGTTRSFAHDCFIPFDLNLNPSKLGGCICQGGCTLTCWDQKPDAGKRWAIRLRLRPALPDVLPVPPSLPPPSRASCIPSDFKPLSPVPGGAPEPRFSAAGGSTGCWGHRGRQGGCAAKGEASH